jgi:hypothetical protein
MHETFPGVMNMAVNTLLKITSNCNSSFVSPQGSGHGNDRIPFIVDIIANT